MGILHYGPEERCAADVLIQLALGEDLGSVGDITSLAVIPKDFIGQAHYIARTGGVVAGLTVVSQVCKAVNPALVLHQLVKDGSSVTPSSRLATVSGPLQDLLIAERTSLNFIQRLSGIASLTRKYVDAVQGTACQVLDTRKTTPGWRILEKYAVRCGGGTNHRMGLHDAVMIKDNHLAGLREHGTPIAEAILRARRAVQARTIVEIEVDNIQDMKEAMTAHPDIILLDNMSVELLCEAVKWRNQHARDVLLEASGGITLATIRSVAESGVDRISVGALTHSASAMDIALDYIE